MTPSGPLPFYLAIEPSPVDGKVAFAVAQQVADNEEVRVGVIVEDGLACEEVFTFSRFAQVLITWSACGRYLAFSQGNIVLTRGPDGALELMALEEDAQALGFDGALQLWILVGGRLESWSQGRRVVACPDVVCGSLGATVAYCRREGEELSLYIREGEDNRLIGRVAAADAVHLAVQGSHIALTLLADRTDKEVSGRILLFDARGGCGSAIFDRRVSAGFNGGPGLAVVLSASGEVYAAYEQGICTRVWRLSSNHEPQAVSPEGFEVFDFELDRNGVRMAVIASDTRSSSGAFDRQLLVGERVGSDWRFDPPIAGVHDMPRWRADSRLELLCGDSGTWLKRTHDPGGDLPPQRAAVEACALGSGTRQLDLLTLPGPRHRRSGVILLPRLNQQFVAGAQSFFFHHLLFWIARSLAADGHTVVTPCAPGAIGRGHSRREVSGFYFDAVAAGIEEIASALRGGGCGAVGLFAGSLAAVPGLRLLGPGSLLSAGAFVAPLFEASIPVTAPLKDQLVDDPRIKPLEAAAAELTVPLLVIHGGRDEVAPLSQVHRLSSAVAHPELAEICILADEGHIFMRPETWRLTAAKMAAFFAARLAPACDRTKA